MTLLVQATATRADLCSPAGGVAAGDVAQMAVEFGSDPGTPPVGRLHPWPILEGWTVTDVAPMAAVERGHPLPGCIGLERDDHRHDLSLPHLSAPSPASTSLS